MAENQAKLIKTGKFVETECFCFPLPMLPVFRFPEIGQNRLKFNENRSKMGEQSVKKIGRRIGKKWLKTKQN